VLINICVFKIDVFIVGISLMKHPFVVTHTIHQTEISTLLDSWVTDIPSVKNACPQKLLRIFSCNPNMLKCFSVEDHPDFFLSPVKFMLVDCGICSMSDLWFVTSGFICSIKHYLELL